MSQATAARRAGIDRQQWYRIESGRSGTRRGTVISIANAIAADATEALTRAGYAPTEPRTRAQRLQAALASQGVDGINLYEGIESLDKLTDEEYDDMLQNILLTIELSVKRSQRK
jgi:DNA-binding XRE family transcriptional regulator